MALTTISTDYNDLDQIPAYEPAFLTVTSSASAVEVVRMEIRERSTPASSFVKIADLSRQPDLGTTDQFTFNLAGIAQDRLSANNNVIGYGYPNGATTNEWKQYQFLFDELSTNASGQLVVTDNDKGWDGVTGFTEETYGVLGIHYASWHDQGNQYYIGNITNNLVDFIGYAFDEDAQPTHRSAANSGRFLTDLTGITITEPWSMTLDFVAISGFAISAGYRHTLSSVVYDRVTALNSVSNAIERHRLRMGFKDLAENSDFTIANQVLTAYDAGDDDGYEVLLKSGANTLTSPRYKVTLADKSGCRKALLEWVNPYGAVDSFEFNMKSNDLFTSKGEMWERSDYESFSTKYGSGENYPQMLQRQRDGRYILELESEFIPQDYGHLIKKQMMLAPKAWIQLQMGSGGFARDDEQFTATNITDRIPVTLEFEEEEILINRRERGYISLSLRAVFSRKQTAQRT